MMLNNYGFISGYKNLFVMIIFISSNRSVTMDFSSKSFITSKADLEGFVKKCYKCYQTIDNGNFIVNHEILQQVNIYKTRQRKLCLIVNSESVIQGHWVVLLVIKAPIQVAIYLDSQNMLKRQRPKVYLSIEKFCKRNSLHLLDKSFQIQNLNHNNCGYHCLHYLAKFVHMSVHSFDHYVASLKRNPSKMKELSIYCFVQRHYNLRHSSC